jgi:DNA-binding MarR family transcriptional regulator
MNRSETFIPVLNEWITLYMHRSMQNLHRFSKESGISMSQIFALTFIQHKGTCGVSDLGEGMGVSNAAASQLLDKLAQQEMIERTEDPADRRGKQITLTEKGTQMIKDSIIARQKWFSELENSLSAMEKEQAVDALHLLISKGKQLDPSPTPHFAQNILNQ